MIRVLLAGGDPMDRERLASVLAETGVAEVVAGVADTHGLFATVEREELDVVMVDERIGPAPAAQAVQELVAMRPFLGVIVLVADSDPRSATTAMDAGARSILPLRPAVDQTRTRLESAAGFSRSLRAHLSGDSYASGQRGRVLALAGSKGGVGTTVLASLMARELMARGASVCLVDLDLRGGDVAFYADVVPRRDLADLADVASELTGRSVREVVTTSSGGLAVLAAPSEPERSEDIGAAAVRAIVAQLRTQFEHVVVDAGSRLDEVTATALEVADDVLLVTLPDIVALRAARRVLDGWERLNVRSRAETRVLLNRASRKVEVQGDLVEQILSASVIGEVPADFAQLEPAVNTGTLLQSRLGSVSQAVGMVIGALGPTVAGVAAEPVAASRRRAGRRVGRPSPRATADAGQIVVETPVVVLLFFTMALFCLQGLLAGVSVMVAGHAAAEGARVAAVSSSYSGIRAAAVDSLPGGWDEGVEVSQPSGRVEVGVSTPALFPFLGTIDVQRSAAVLEEQ